MKYMLDSKAKCNKMEREEVTSECDHKNVDENLMIFNLYKREVAYAVAQLYLMNNNSANFLCTVTCSLMLRK